MMVVEAILDVVVPTGLVVVAGPVDDVVEEPPVLPPLPPEPGLGPAILVVMGASSTQIPDQK